MMVPSLGMTVSRSVIQKLLLLVGILFFSFGLRVTGTMWDQGQHLHPDERFLVMVMTDLTWPASIGEYFDATSSQLNPRNVGYDFYVYGVWPLLIVKAVAGMLRMDTYEGLLIVGRLIAALMDTLTVGLVWLLAREWRLRWKRLLGLETWTALAYGLMVLPIQWAHFMTMEAFVVSTFGLALVAALGYERHGRPATLLLVAMASAAALTAKLSAAYGLVLIGIIVFARCWRNRKKEGWRCFRWLGIGVVVGYVSMRVMDPTMWVGLAIDQRVLEGLRSLDRFNHPEVWFPPGLQWINRPLWFGLGNTVQWGLGILQSGWVLVGFVLSVRWWIQKPTSRWWIGALLVWALWFLTWQSMQYVKSLRYYALLYPLMAVLIGVGVLRIQVLLKEKYQYLMIGFIVLSLAVWPAYFMGIYSQPHSRVQASDWIYENIPSGARLGVEHWDDGLPLNLDSKRLNNRYQFVELEVFARESEEQWEAFEKRLELLDYYIQSSDRAWAPIMRADDRYPKLALWYQALEQGETEFELVHRVTVFPSLRYLGINHEIDDRASEEAFRVYDHPEVRIYRKKTMNVSLQSN